MFKSILKSLGVGGATIETVVDNPEIVAGEDLRGEVRIKVGTTDQDIRGVALELVTRCRVKGHDDEYVYTEIVVSDAAAGIDGPLVAGETRVLPMTLEVPLFAPLSVGSTSTVLRTRLDIARAIDARDSDTVRVLPTRAMSAVFDALDELGFRLAETEVEHASHREIPFVQEFDFKPTSSGDYGIDEVEIAFSPSSDGVDVLLTVDNRGGFFTGGRERATRFRVRDADAGRADLAGEMRRMIESLR